MQPVYVGPPHTVYGPTEQPATKVAKIEECVVVLRLESVVDKTVDDEDGDEDIETDLKLEVEVDTAVVMMVDEGGSDEDVDVDLAPAEETEEAGLEDPPVIAPLAQKIPRPLVPT